jgi:hypothetical protein
MARKALVLILAIYLALAAEYATVTPFGQAPDETAHALYIQHLVQHHTLPVLRRAHRDAYEYHQPPLYYLLAAPFWAAASPSELFQWSHPPAAPFLPALGCTAARGVSICIGALGVWLIAMLARAVTPGTGAARDALALGAAGFAALLPMRLATAASVSNDMLAEAVFTAGLLLMIRMIGTGATPRRAAGIGVVLGLGILTKSSDMLLLPVALVALLFASRTAVGQPESLRPFSEGKHRRSSAVGASATTAPPQDAARFLRCAAAMFGAALLIGGPWMLRNAVLYGDPLGTKAFEQYFQDTPTPDLWAQLLGYNRLDVLIHKTLPLTFESFWGVFGHMNRFMGAFPRGVQPPGWAYLLADRGYPPPSWVYPLLLIPTLIAAVGLGIQVFRRSGVQVFGHSGVQAGEAKAPPILADPEHLNARTPERLTLALAAFLVLAAFLRFNMEFFQAQGRYLFPAMGPIAVGFTSGWLAWWPRRCYLLVILLLAGMLSLALFALCSTLASPPTE